MSSIQYIVSLSENAFFTIVTSALEAYRISHPEDSDQSHVPIETYGNLWGYQAKTKRGEDILQVSLADVDASAERTPNSVRPHQKSFDIKEDFVDSFKPDLEYLGDFHSHPYDFENDKVTSALAVEKNKLYTFSRSDFKHAKSLSETRNYRVGMVATVYGMEKRANRETRYISPDNSSCIRFSYNEYVIWLKAHVLNEKEFVRDEKVALACSSIGFSVY